KIEEETGERFDLDAYRFSKLRELIDDKIPAGTVGRQLRGDGVARIFRTTILNEIQSELSTRNAVLASPDRLTFRQVFHFEYSDGGRMLTVGGMLVSNAESGIFDACAFDKVDFVRMGDEPYTITVPCLTSKEVRHLNAQLPCEDSRKLVAPGVPEADLRTYAKMYRYFPSFTEILFT